MKHSFRPLLFLFLFLVSLQSIQAQPDSVVISGRILNLTAPLYRQAPVITFTRNNILLPQTELTRQALIQADGSFRVAMPLIYPQEEVYLDYGGKVYTTFLAAPGSLQVTFDADSLYKSKRLFYFAGVNADANNQYPRYLAEETRILKENKRYGESFFEQLWGLSPGEARRALERRADVRMAALLPIAQQGEVAPALRAWVEALVKEEQLSALYEYALVNDVSVDREIRDSLAVLIRAPMTFQRVQWVVRLSDYADRRLDKKAYTYPNQSKSLGVGKMAALIRQYVRPLSADEVERLEVIVREGSATTRDLDFLNSLYGRERKTLDLLTMIEKRKRMLEEEFDAPATDLLVARTFVQSFYQLSLSEQKLLYSHVAKGIRNPLLAQSLNELYRLEVKDSTYIRLIQERTDLSSTPTEVLSGIWLSETDLGGKAWLKKVLEFNAGKTLYVIKWNLFDEASRNEILYAPALRAQLPADVEFLYIHLPGTDYTESPRLWKQYIVRNKLKGIHLFINENQAAQLLFKLNPLAFPSFGIIKPNGKYYTRNAPSPANGQEAAQTLLRARQVR
jgi:hypothetical protein